MWLGELITEHGIGNGISIIFTGIVSRLPAGLYTIGSYLRAGTNIASVALFVVIAVVVIVGIVAFMKARGVYLFNTPRES